jgi:hypothetical protein
LKNQHKYKNLNWIIGLVIIILIYTLFYVYFSENEAIKHIPRKIRHVIKFLATCSTYLVGTYFLGNIQIKWMQNLWHFIHIGLLSILILIGLFDLFILPINKSTRDITVVLQEFLISPVLYFAMSIINKRLN